MSMTTTSGDARKRFVCRHCYCTQADEHGNCSRCQEPGNRMRASQPLKAVDTTPEFVESNRVVSTVNAWEKFPVEHLPEPLRSFVTNASESLGSDPAYIAAALLVTIGSAVGTTRRVCCKGGWYELPILWVGLVGKSGCGKSPALSLATQPIKRLQTLLAIEHQQSTDFAYDAGADEGGEPPKMPCVYCEDTTVEALVDRLVDHPRGLVVIRDELAGWVDSMNSYKGGKGGDESAWLSFFDGREAKHDRKSAKRSTLFVQRAAVSLVGGVQPGVLRECLTARRVASGMAARLLLIHPPETVQRWSDVEVDPQKQAAVQSIVEYLYRHFTHGDDGEPITIRLEPEALRLFRLHHDDVKSQQVTAPDHEAAMLSKSIAITARLALILHCAKLAAFDSTITNIDQIQVDTMDKAVLLGRWFTNETLRVTRALREPPEAQSNREILELVARLQREGKPTTVRELMRHCRHWTDPDDAEVDLNRLHKQGKGHWLHCGTTERGGRPTRQFKLGPAPAPNDGEA